MSGCGQFLEVLSANEKSTQMPGLGLKRDIRVILGHFVKKKQCLNYDRVPLLVYKMLLDKDIQGLLWGMSLREENPVLIGDTY